MLTRRSVIAVVSVVASLGIGAALATAASIPTYHVYQKCASKGNCSVGVYLNKKQNRVVAMNSYAKCSDGSGVSISLQKKAKVSSKGKFKFTVATTNYDQTAGTTVQGTATVSGKVKKGSKVTIEYSVDKYPAACQSVASGKATAKYRGVQHGG